MSCTNSKQLLENLAAPFAPQDIEWRVQTAVRGQSGIRILVLPYIESRAVMVRFDEVCGVFWQTHFDKIMVGNKEAFQCRLSVKIGDEWITRTDAAEVSDLESVKGGHSNALKRAGVQWGIGRYLYELPSYWVELKQKGKHRVYGKFKISRKEEMLSGYFDSPTLPNWALPESPSNQQNQSVRKNQQTKQQKPDQQKISEVQTEKEKQQQSLHFVKQLLQSLEVPLQFVAPLLKKASGSTVPFEQASTEDLKKLYHVLHPVYVYVSVCKKMGLDEDDILYYAQTIFQERLESIHALYFKMTREMTEKTLELIREDRKLPKQAAG